MGTQVETAPHAPVAADTRRWVSQQIRRIGSNMGLPDLSIQLANRHAQNYLGLTGRKLEALRVGCGMLGTEDVRIRNQAITSWPKTVLEAMRVTAVRLLLVIVGAGLVLGVARALYLVIVR